MLLVWFQLSVCCCCFALPAFIRILSLPSHLCRWTLFVSVFTQKLFSESLVAAFSFTSLACVIHIFASISFAPFCFILATILDNSIGHFYRKMKGKWSCCLAVAEVAPPRQPLKFAWNHRYHYDSFFIKDEMPDSQP